jgi:hypothetical protein
MPRIILGVVLILFLNPVEMAAQHLSAAKTDSTAKWRGLMVLPQNFYKQHLGFFCRQEDLLQKKTKTNIYFRLGSKAYVDYLEQKPNAVKKF